MPVEAGLELASGVARGGIVALATTIGVGDGGTGLLVGCGTIVRVRVASGIASVGRGEGILVTSGGDVFAVGSTSGRVGTNPGGSVLAVGSTMLWVGTAVGGRCRTVVALGSARVGGVVAVAAGTAQI